jgi:hypothetical protein
MITSTQTKGQATVCCSEQPPMEWTATGKCVRPVLALMQQQALPTRHAQLPGFFFLQQ